MPTHSIKQNREKLIGISLFAKALTATLLLAAIYSCGKKAAFDRGHNLEQNEPEREVMQNESPTEPNPALDRPLITELPQSYREVSIDLPQTHSTNNAEQESSMLPDLFANKSEEKSVSIKGRPTFQTPDSEGGIPSLEGAKLDVKIKLD